MSRLEPPTSAARHRAPLSKSRMLWRDLRGWFAAMFALTIAVSGVGLLGPATSAHAAEVPDAISNVRTTTTEVVAGQNFRLDFDWSVPDHTPAGSTFSLTLPAELENANTVVLTLRAPDGSPVAEGVWSGRTVTFTLSDYVTTHPYSIAGTGWFMARVDTDTVGGGDADVTTTVAGTTLVIRQTAPDNGGGGEVDPTPKPPAERDAYKWGWFTRDDQGTVEQDDAILWVMSPPIYSTDTARMVIVDEAPAGAGWEFSCGTARMEHFLENPTNTWFDTYTLADTDSPLVERFSCEPNRIELVLVNVPAYDLFQIVVNANVTDTNRTSFSNTFSTTTDDGRTAGDSTRVSLEGGGDGSGIPGSQLRLQKVVAGDVPADAPSSFTIIATCTAPGSESAVEYSREVPGDGSTWISVAPLEPGTECTVTEPETYGAEMTASAPTVTITADAPSDVVITNTFPEIPEEPEVPVDPETPENPEVPELPTLALDDPPAASSLAYTGFSSPAGAVLIGMLSAGVLFLVVAIAWRRRVPE